MNVDASDVTLFFFRLRTLQRCEVLVWGLKRLIYEMHGTQVYVDKDGAVKRRVRPKNMLTMIVLRQQDSCKAYSNQEDGLGATALLSPSTTS